MSENKTSPGIAFVRQTGGTVRVIVASRQGPGTEIDLDPDAWAAAVAGVSAQGAAPERVGLVRNFHMYEPAGVDANGSPVDEFPAPTGT